MSLVKYLKKISYLLLICSVVLLVGFIVYVCWPVPLREPANNMYYEKLEISIDSASAVKNGSNYEIYLQAKNIGEVSSLVHGFIIKNEIGNAVCVVPAGEHLNKNLSGFSESVYLNGTCFYIRPINWSLNPQDSVKINFSLPVDVKDENGNPIGNQLEVLLITQEGYSLSKHIPLLQ